MQLTGDDLSAFADIPPTAHAKVFLPPSGSSTFVTPSFGPQGPIWPEGPRPTVRTYTPRRFIDGLLEIQFLVHGDGPASAWAAVAEPGLRVAVSPPGGRFPRQPPAGRWWIAGDESAIPAVSTLLEALPDNATGEVHLEADGPADHLDLPAGPHIQVHWHHRSPGIWGEELLTAATRRQQQPGDHVWIACEAAAVRRLRRFLLDCEAPGGIELTTRGYWRAGSSNHPDHDYGEGAADAPGGGRRPHSVNLPTPVGQRG